MRIVLMIDWFLYYSVELANALSKEHEVMLITRDHNLEISSPDSPIDLDEFLDECLNRNIVREKLRYRPKNLRNFLEVLRVFKKIKAFNPDVIHIQESMDWRIILTAKMIGFDKVVLTVHDVVWHLGEEASRIHHRYLISFMRTKAKKIIVHGENLRGQFLSRYKGSKSKIYVIPIGVFPIYLNWDDESIEEEKNTILFFGRFNKYKGIDMLIKAEPLITKEIPDARIIIAGRGEELSKYDNLITKKRQFEIHNRFISNAEVAKFFRRAAVVVLPYIEASQSGVIPIAYAFGKPVVVTNVGSIPEVVEDGKTGFIVPPRNPEDLANAVIKILKNKKLKKTMSKNVLAKASTELSWSHIAKKTTEIYSLD